jgi:hypothetical protein
MPTPIETALNELQAARLELYEASAERRRLSLAPMRKPPLIDAANTRVEEAREAVGEKRVAARILIFGA